jgi:tetratricopeptide (TPR) repeat protein
LHGLESGNSHFILAPKPELYDLSTDPKEKNNKIAQLPKVAQELRQKLQNYLGKSKFTTPDTVDPETMEKLESLGYISAPSSKTKSLNAADPKEKMAIWNQIQEGIGQFSNSDFNSAAKTFEKVLASDKDLLIAYDYLGSSYIQLKQWTLAEKVFRQSLARNIEWSGLHMKLGEILSERGDFLEAQKELEKSIELDKLNVSAYYYLGNVFRNRKDFLKAIESYEQALKINPNYVYAKNGMGMTYAMMKKYDKAANAFREAIDIEPNGASHYFNLAIALERLKRNNEARNTYQQFLKLSNEKEFSREREKAKQAIEQLKSNVPE